MAEENTNTGFTHPPLSQDADSLRILVLHPGAFDDPISCSLEAKSFQDKPKYVALSYTWGFSHDDTADDFADKTGDSPPPPITVNGEPFHIMPNLRLALQHLRSPKHDGYLWVDAVCINQNDEKERNVQVSLMADIYKAAVRVVAWVGMPDEDAQSEITEFIASTARGSPSADKYKASHNVTYAAHRFFNPSAVRTRRAMAYSPVFGTATLRRVATSAYWTRLWIVQETFLAHTFDVVCGPYVWEFEEVCQHCRANGIDSGNKTMGEAVAAMEQIDRIRRSRFTQHLTLENLLELFCNAACSRPQDRVFGLLGCAIDIQPTTLASKIALRGCASVMQSPPTVKKAVIYTTVYGDARILQTVQSFDVDYSLSLPSLWFQLICTFYYKPPQADISLAFGDASAIAPMNIHIQETERKFTLARTSGIIQHALGNTGYSTIPASITMTGYVAGQIELLGPQCADLLRSQSWRQAWYMHWHDYYTNDAYQSSTERENAARMETLRRLDDEYMVKLQHCEPGATARIRRNDDTLAYGQLLRSVDGTLTAPDVSNHGLGRSDPEYAGTIKAKYDGIWGASAEGSKDTGPMICVGSNNIMGLVPSGTRPGDVIVRFINCDAAVVMRPDPSSDEAHFLLLGPADVADVMARDSLSPIDEYAELCLLSACDGYSKDPMYRGTMDINLTFGMLQLVTAHTNAYGPPRVRL